MSAPEFVGFDEAAPAAQAPAIIQLGPPAAPPPKTRHGSEERKRLHVKRSRYDDAELAAFEARARACGLSDGAFIRASTLGDAGPRARSRATVDRELLAHNTAALNRLGSNVNQTTRALNEFLLIARETGADRLARVVIDAIEQNRALAADLALTLAANRHAVGYDREG
jgi:hypothetical protein